MSYEIGKFKFKFKVLSLNDDTEIAELIESINIKVPVDMNFLNAAIMVTGGFLTEILRTQKAAILIDRILQLDQKPSLFSSLLMRFKKFRLYYYGKHVKGEVKEKIFTDFFTEGTVYAANLVNHFLMLLTNRMTHLEESKLKD